MPKPTKPEIELAVAGQKAKASTYNDNMQSMLDYVDECMDYAVNADLSNLDSDGEEHFDTRYLRNTQTGATDNPIYIDEDGEAQAVTQLSSTLISNSGIGETVKTSYTSGSSGYIIYTNGYCIQWGHSGTNASSVTFLKKFANANYNLTTTSIYSTAVYLSTVSSKSATGFSWVSTGAATADWCAVGVLASGQY